MTVDPVTAETRELRALWFAAEQRAIEVGQLLTAAQVELALLRDVLRATVEDTADPCTDEMRCLRFPSVTPEQNAAVCRALGGAA